jgi:hypothetical protein
VQPFPDVDEELATGLGKAIGKDESKRLADPIKVSSDGILLDGHQRLKQMLKLGRKFVDARDVWVVEEADADNALDYAIRLNVLRRQISVEMKIDKARELKALKWSHALIARAMMVTSARVSQWLKMATDYQPPSEVVGEDGKVYTPPRRKRQDQGEDAEQRNPWKPDGYAYKGLTQTRKHLQNVPLGGLNPLQSVKLRALVEDVMDAADRLLAGLNALEHDDPYKPA